MKLAERLPRVALGRPGAPSMSRLGAAAAVIAFVILVPIVVTNALSDYWITLSISGVITAVVLLSVGILTDRAGMLAVAPMSFAGIGAWAMGYCNVHDVPGGFYVWIILAGLATVPFGLIVGLPALRLRGINLAVITLSFAVALSSVLNAVNFPGSLDYEFVERPSNLLGEGSFFLFCWIVFVVIAAIIWLVGRRPTGAAWRSVARSERATAAMGISVPKTKLFVFVLSAFIAGLSGALLVGQVGIATPESFSPTASLVIFAVAILVGAGYPEGALLGGVFSAFMPEILRQIGLPQDLGNILFAVGAVQVLAAGTSITGSWRATGRRWARKLARVESTPPAAPAAAAARPPAAPTAKAAAPPPAAAQPILQVQGLTVRFGNVVALDQVTLKVPPRAVSGLIGPNGAGKSTLVDAVTGFISDYEGSVELDGQPIDRLSVHRRIQAGIRRTFQQERTVPTISVGDYVRLASRRRLGFAEVAETLEFVGGPNPRMPIAEVDVGARRIIEVAGCLAARPKVLLLDEPAAGLAQAESLLLAERIAQMPERFGCAVLLIEHDMEVVTAACSHITVLDFGKTIAEGAPSEVLEMGEVITAYLGEPGVAVG